LENIEWLVNSYIDLATWNNDYWMLVNELITEVKRI
jgi:hypothetical protein